MGMKHFSSDGDWGSYTSPSGNPDPSRWKAIRWTAVGPHLLIELKYLDCKNYEGRKILFYKNWTLEELAKQGRIDPHFSDEKIGRSPFARFEPTDEGWFAGILLGNSLS